MRIAYFVNQYPKVSHSFIRREIHALERQGVRIERVAVRASSDELVDQQDKEELGRTHYLLGSSVWEIVSTTFSTLLARPARFFSMFWSALAMGWRSDRGVVKHFYYFFEACVLRKWLEEKNVAHVHAHFGTNPAMVAMLASGLGGPSYSFTVHGPEEFDKPEFISLDRKIRHADFVVGVSSYGRSQLLRRTEHACWRKIRVVHCGVDSSFYDYSKSKGNYSDNLVCVGRICEQKGQLLLVEAIAELVAEGEKVHLTFVGDGPMRGELEEMIAGRRLESHITVTGWISNSQVRERILNARASVLPSFAEGLPVVLIESMALRRPVLSTYVAGIPELVQPGENGWLISPGNLVLLKDAIRTVLYTSPRELDRLGENASVKIRARHDIDVEAEKLHSLFQSSVTGRVI